MSNADVPVTRYERRGRAAWITLDSPGNRNALSAPLVQELGQHLRTASIDPEVRVIVLTGAGPAFCAGADLKNRGDAVAPGSERASPFVETLRALRDGPKPVIAAVNGHAYGGGIGLVAAADIAIAVEGARFSFSEVRVELLEVFRLSGKLSRRLVPICPRLPGLLSKLTLLTAKASEPSLLTGETGL